MSAETTATAADTGPALETDGLSVSYGRTTVIEGLTFAVPRGSVYALLGRNGAGKSSLLRVLLGQRPAASGRARLLGEDPWTHRTSLMARVGVVPEEPDAPPEMTPVALSAFCARLHARWDAPAVAERLRRFEVPADRSFGRLSKGQKGAVMLSLALGHSPQLLLLDDPTLGLDVVARDAVFQEVIGDLADRGMTVFVSAPTTCGRSRGSPTTSRSCTAGASPSPARWRRSKPSGASRSSRSSRRWRAPGLPTRR